jgi:hypothetical protein
MYTIFWLENLLRRPRHRREENIIRMDLWEIELEGVDWILCEHSNKCLGSIKSREFLD